MLDTYEEEKVLFITAEDETLNTSLRYIKAGVTAVRVNPLSSDRASMAEGIESKLKEANFGRAGWMVGQLTIYLSEYTSACPLAICEAVYRE